QTFAALGERAAAGVGTAFHDDAGGLSRGVGVDDAHHAKGAAHAGAILARVSAYCCAMSLTVAFQGERGAFSEAAARKLVGAAIDVLPCRSFDDVFAAVQSGAAACAVVPIENTLAGSVLRNYELLGDAGLEIAGEVLLRIRLSVMARPGTRLESVRRVLSHPVALAQCQRFLAAHPAIEAVATYDTAGGVKIVMESGRDDEAAIAGAPAAEIYGAAILAENVEDHAAN